MASADIALFVGATFVAGAAGFAFGLVAAAVWLHILAPLQTTTLIVVFGLVVQGYAVWKLRRALRPGRLWPLLLGGVIGVPLGAELLRSADPAHVRWAVGALLILFVVYSVMRPSAMLATAGGRAADAGIGELSGVGGGVTGLAGIVATMWCTLRGWPKDEQRAVFQLVGVAIFLATFAWLGARGAVSGETVRLIVLGLPAVLLGVWAGLKLYGRFDEAGFRKVVFALLCLSGLALLLR